jgi:hypothetical protein
LIECFEEGDWNVDRILRYCELKDELWTEGE